MTPLPEHPVRQRVVARALLLGREGVLVQRKYRPERGEYFGLPGGTRESGESLIAALQRECFEEIGTGVANPRLAAVADYRHPDRRGEPVDRLECVFVAELPAGYVAGNGPRPDRHQTDVQWLATADVATAPLEPPFLRRVVARIAADPSATPGYLGDVTEPCDTSLQNTDPA